jgi:hypothetical protein
MYIKTLITLFLLLQTSLFALTLEKERETFISGQIYDTVFDTNNQRIYAGNYNGLNVLDDNLGELFKLELLDPVHKIALDRQNSRLFLANDNSGLRILDINNGDEVVLLASLETGAQCKDVKYLNEENLVVVVDDVAGLKLIDVSDSNALSVLDHYPFLSSIKSIAIDEDKKSIYIALNSFDIMKISYKARNFSMISHLGKIENVEEILYYEEALIAVTPNAITTHTINSLGFLEQLSGVSVHNAKEIEIMNQTLFASSSANIALIDLKNLDQLNVSEYYLLEESLHATMVDALSQKVIISYWDKGLALLHLSYDVKEQKELDLECIDEEVYAKNPKTLGWATFYSSCDIPDGWERTPVVPATLKSKIVGRLTNAKLATLPSGWHLLGTGRYVEDVSEFKNIKALWTYKGSAWKSFSPDEKSLASMQDAGFEIATSINALEGVWIEK